MLLPIFFHPPPPHRSQLELLLPWRRQIQPTSKPWPPSKIAAHKCSVCLAVHPSNLLSDKQALNSWLAMFPLEFFVPSSQQNSIKTFFCTCTTFPTLGGLPLSVLCLLGLFGAASPMTSPAGQNPACTANRVRSITTPPAATAHPHPSTAVCSSPH